MGHVPCYVKNTMFQILSLYPMMHRAEDLQFPAPSYYCKYHSTSSAVMKSSLNFPSLSYYLYSLIKGEKENHVMVSIAPHNHRRTCFQDYCEY
jgi:hypothetical protein